VLLWAQGGQASGRPRPGLVRCIKIRMGGPHEGRGALEPIGGSAYPACNGFAARSFLLEKSLLPETSRSCRKAVVET
jgi:hypothetical protein